MLVGHIAVYVGLVVAGTVCVKGQPVLNGFAVGTCYSDGKDTGPVVALMDVRKADLQSVNQPWSAPKWYGPSTSPWNRANLGEVFGIAFDASGNIYVAATRVYRQIGPPGGPGGAGAIYRLDAVTGSISNFVTTLNSSCGAVIGTSTLPNTGSGLGNIAYDVANDQFFATNFEDGKIYRISSSGVIKSTFDPFAPDDCIAGIVPLSERIWGIGVYNNRVYFARWNEDCLAESDVVANEIWSVALAGEEFTGTEQVEILLPALPNAMHSSPVADIAFSQGGRMLLAERTMVMIGGDPLRPSAHRSRVLEYEFVGNSWDQLNTIYAIGSNTYPYGVGYNAAGGVDYAYGSYDSLSEELRDCDSAVWSSGDALKLEYNPISFVYGFQRTSAYGGSPSNSQLIDADEDTLSQDKEQIGDIEVFKSCEVPTACDSVSITATTSVFGTAPNRICSTALTLTNNYRADFLTSVTVDVASSNTAFIASSLGGPPGWGVQQTSATSATWSPVSGSIPLGQTIGMSFILFSTSSPPQELVVTWRGRNGVECVDTIQIICPPDLPPPSCLQITRQETRCKEKGIETGTFEVEFEIQNLDQFFSLPAHHLIVWPTANSPITLSPTEFEFTPGLQFGESSGPLTLSFSAPYSMVGEEVCIVMQLHGEKMENGYFSWCCRSDTFCFIIPECKDCCDDILTGITSRSVRQQGNHGVVINSGLNIGPNSIVSAAARIVSIERSPVYGGGLSFGTGGLTSGRIVDGSLMPSLPLQYGLNPATSEVAWGLNPSGVDMSNGNISLTLDFPNASIGWCQWDTLTILMRYTFTDSNWVTCDTTLEYKIRREGELEYRRTPDSLSLDSTDRRLIAQEWQPDSVARPVSLTMINPHDGEVIIYSPTWAQRYRFTELKLQPGVAVTIDSLGDPGTGASGVIRDRAAVISLTVEPGESSRLHVRFNNPNNVDFITASAVLKYVDMNDPRDTNTTTPITVYGLVPGVAATDSLHGRQNSLSSVQTFSLEFINTNRMSRSISHVEISVDDDARILAVGPPKGDTNLTDVVLSVTRDATGTTSLQPWSTDEEYISYIDPGSRITPVYLTVRTDNGDSTMIRYRTFDENGVLITEGSTILVANTSAVEEDDIPTTRSSIELFPVVPDPGFGIRTVQVLVPRVEADVVMAVYDLRGNEVLRILDNERMSRGTHVYIFDSSELPSGTYYLVLSTSTESVSQPMKVAR